MKKVEQSTRSQVFDFVVKELQAILIVRLAAQLRAYTMVVLLSLSYFLLAKLALNSEVYTDDNWEDGSNDGKYTFTIEQGMNTWQR